jgi:hypothetical protein
MKELIAMCDHPKIQDRWEEKRGDVCTDHEYKTKLIVTDLYESERIDVISWDGDKDNCHPSNLIYIPSIEDVLEWLEAYEYSIDVVGESDLWEIFHVDSVWSDTPIKALLKAYMHLEHNKTWDGDKWV